MKMIIRVDDVGYTDVCNIGTFLTIEKGIATAADIMLDCPGSEDALRRLRDYPWISLGWHTHFWGSPVLPSVEVPSLVADNGHFRQKLMELPDVGYEEALAELRAELRRCERILGRIPVYGGLAHGNDREAETPFFRAMCDICEEFGIAAGTASSVIDSAFMPDKTLEERTMPASPEWTDRKIFFPPAPYARILFSSEISEILKYGELSRNYFLKDEDYWLERQDDRVIVTVWHPGFVDEYMMFEGEQGEGARHFDHCRLNDVHTLCSEEFKSWIRENKVELMNYTDAMYGRHDYQNHLRAVGSTLAVMTDKGAVTALKREDSQQ